MSRQRCRRPVCSSATAVAIGRSSPNGTSTEQTKQWAARRSTRLSRMWPELQPRGRTRCPSSPRARRPRQLASRPGRPASERRGNRRWRGTRRRADARGKYRIERIQKTSRAAPEFGGKRLGERRPRRAPASALPCGDPGTRRVIRGSMPARRGRAPRDDGLADARDPGVPPTSGHGRRISTVRLRRERTVWREKRPASPVAGHSLSERREANASRRARRQRL
jgi:hypothetical protein